MATEKVITGALAIVRQNGTPVARMRNIRATENTTRQRVKGLGTALTIEAPVTDHAGTWSCDFFETLFKTSGLKGAINRSVQTNGQFEDQLLFNDGFQIDIFKKISDGVDTDTGLIRTDVTPFATIKDALIESDAFEITEGNVGTRSQSGLYLSPILYPS